MYQQGDIVLVPFPFTNQAGAKRRPALVISGKILNRTKDILLVQITKELRKDNFSVALNNTDLTRPLNFVSEIRCNKILVAEQSLIQKTISSVTPEIVKKVVEKISMLLEK